MYVPTVLIIVNMSKSCCVECHAVVLAVICLPVILLSLDADAQPTVDVDEIRSCGSSLLEEVANAVKVIASAQQENAKDIAVVKNLLAVEFARAETSKQALVSALVGELLVSQHWFNTKSILTHLTINDYFIVVCQDARQAQIGIRKVLSAGDAAYTPGRG